MKSLKTKRIFVLIWVMLASSVLASVWILIDNTHNLSKPYSLYWGVVIKLIDTSILIIISFKLWKIVNAYTNKYEWQANFYQKVRQIGYWALVLTVLNPVIQSVIISSNYSVHNAQTHTFNYVVIRVATYGVLQSPAMWVLSLSIFLFAELLQIANQIKVENESII